MERRLFARIKKEKKVEVVKQKKTVEAKMCDLGGEGVGIITESPLRLNEKVNLLFSFGEGKMSLEGKVVWMKKIEKAWRIGINFTSPKFLLISRLLYS